MPSDPLAQAKVWVTRAQPGADRTAERLAILGLTPLIAPLLAIHTLPVRLDLTGVQALAFTSRNGVQTFAALSSDRSLPVFAVGDATAAEASKAGFADVRSAGGDLIALAGLIRAEAASLSLLHPSAVEPAGDLAALVGNAARVAIVPIYEARETGAPPPPIWDIVLIHSPRAARVLTASLNSATTAGRLALAISPAAATPLADLSFAEIRIAQAPTESSLLATLGKRGASV